MWNWECFVEFEKKNCIITKTNNIAGSFDENASFININHEKLIFIIRTVKKTYY